MKIPILMYHQVTSRPHPAFKRHTVTPEVFTRQMSWLERAGYHPINFDALFDGRDGIRTLPSRPVVITFDDGYHDCIEQVVPILQARRFTAVFFLVSGLIGRTSEWLLADRGVEFPLVNWGTVRSLEEAGFQCAAHSVNHPSLIEMPAPACRNELLRARLMLEDRLGHSVCHMAYPFGHMNERVRNIVAETGYRSACSVRIGLSTFHDDPLALPRVHINGQDSLPDFICKLHTARAIGELLRCRAGEAVRRLMKISKRKKE